MVTMVTGLSGTTGREERGGGGEGKREADRGNYGERGRRLHLMISDDVNLHLMEPKWKAVRFFWPRDKLNLKLIKNHSRLGCSSALAFQLVETLCALNCTQNYMQFDAF